MIASCNVSNVTNKLKSYVGFAKKSGNLKIGSDNILAYKKFSVIIISNSISDNAKNKLFNHSQKTNSDFVVVGYDIINTVMESETIKAISITEKNLASACLECIKKIGGNHN